jgi:hypothetical protein
LIDLCTRVNRPHYLRTSEREVKKCRQEQALKLLGE